MATARKKGKAEAAHTFRALLLELPIYAVLVVAYFFLVLHFLVGWLGDLHARHTLIYALVSIGLIIGQAVILEWITTMLLRLFRGGRSE
ncbi:MAG: hypothetical protein M3Z22_07605 [Verrucomicrobiota bacterium]|nr:hypothetical protein [Verrucomicrobiota bacterium]